MRAVVTRVTSASVTVSETIIGRIDAGLLILLGIAPDDTATDATLLAKKIYDLRIFDDDAGHMNRSLAETGGSALVVSQFTLFGDVRKGRRPSFVAAAPPEIGRARYETFVAAMRLLTPHVATGEFGATMLVTSINDGPVTILIDTTKLF